MVLNKKSQSMLVGLMIFFFVFIVAIILIPPLKEAIGIGRNELGCQYDNLTTGESATCLVIDLYLPYFIAVVLAGSSVYLYIKR